MGFLEDRVAIVTGGGSGIGEATAKKLAHAGAAVVVADIVADSGERVTWEIRKAGGQAAAHKTDVSDEAQVQALVGFAIGKFGPVNILHNNAADLSSATMLSDTDVVAMTVELWDHTMAVNLRGQMLLCKHVVPVMLGHGGGSIINMSSGSSLRGDLGSVAYSASKARVNSLTRSVATAYGKQNITCNAIAPGMVLTPAGKILIQPAALQVLEENHLTPRVGRPEDIADVVAFLASDSARFVTGQIISVDGGILSHMPTVAQMRQLMG